MVDDVDVDVLLDDTDIVAVRVVDDVVVDVTVVGGWHSDKLVMCSKILSAAAFTIVAEIRSCKCCPAEQDQSD